MEYFGVEGEARRIVEFDEKKCKAFLDADKLREIIESRPEIKELPTIVVTIGGVARTGKSFLLNLLASYLAYLEKNGNEHGWMQCSCPIKGISWARSEESITHGIWIFSRPFIVTRHDGKKAAVLLADSQGTGDNQRSSTEIDTLITYIGLQISSIQVLNVKERVNSTELTGMELCTHYADIDDDAPQSMKDTHTENYLFPSLLFLFRDIHSDETLGDDRNLFPNLIGKSKNPTLRKTLEGIEKAFRDINAYKMPYPGEYIARATEGDWKVLDVPEYFLESVSGLARRLFDLEQGPSQCWDSAADLLKNFENMKSHIENNDMPPLTNASDALQANLMGKAYAELQNDFGLQMTQICRSDEPTSINTKEELKQSCDRLKHDAFQKFEMAARYKKYEGSVIASMYRRMVNEYIKTREDEVMDWFELREMVSESQKTQDQLERRVKMQKEQLTINDESLHQNAADKRKMENEIEQTTNELNQSREKVKKAKQKLKEEEEKITNMYWMMAGTTVAGFAAGVVLLGPIGPAVGAAARDLTSLVVIAGKQYIEHKLTRRH